MLIQFEDKDYNVYNEIMKVLEKYLDYQIDEIDSKQEIMLPGLDICLERRKVFCGGKEIHLTKKEYDLLCLLAEHKNIVLSYGQICEKIWSDIPIGKENTVIGYHICKLREKLSIAIPKAQFKIRCVREVGYCLEINNL